MNRVKLRFGSKSTSIMKHMFNNEHKHLVSNRLAKQIDKSTIKRSAIVSQIIGVVFIFKRLLKQKPNDNAFCFNINFNRSQATDHGVQRSPTTFTDESHGIPGQ